MAGVGVLPFDVLREFAWVAVLLPAIGFTVVFLIGKDEKRRSWWKDGAAWAGVGTVAASCVLSFLIFLEVWLDENPYFSPTPFVWAAFPGFDAAHPQDGFYFGTGLHIDGMAALLMFVVSFLSTCIVVYSTAYMHEEKGLRRYYFEICLFIVGMMGMVVVDNYLFAFMFWEIMGLCSYLLIGYWYSKPSAASAAKKAFLVTRVGDVLFLFGIVVLYNTFHTLNYTKLFEEILHPATPLTGAELDAVRWAGLLIFGGAVGKSAQFPLHVWLPDAMEGPTTVSALIHAATMVKAGVYITARTLPILAIFPSSLGLIALIGAFTAFLAATIALVVFDIKRLLAYSTISQLAYMFVGLGTLGVGPALFHLLNHAYFKALMFLGSGSVIHGVGTQDMRQMGGLRTKMKTTYWTMLVGSLSLAGLPLFSGWWSKDEILTASRLYEPGTPFITGPFGYIALDYVFVGWAVFLLGIITAGLTGFYSLRMLFLTFHGKPRYDEKHVHVHESPAPMVNVLVVLAVFSLATGLGTIILSNWVWPDAFEHHIVVEELEHAFTPVVPPREFVDWIANPVLWASTFIALLGMAIAWLTYIKGYVNPADWVGVPRPDLSRPMRAANSFGRACHRVFFAKWGMDWLFLKIAAAGDKGLAATADVIDRNVIDGIVRGFTRSSFAGGDAVRRATDGIVRNYATWIVAGLAIMLVLLKYVLPGLTGGVAP